MVLIGQYDSPFVRRVAVALNHYGEPFERRVLSVFRDFDAVLALNPLGKVPILTLDDGESLFDSRFILEYLDGLAAPEKRLVPAAEPARREVLRMEAVAVGLCEKLYERGYEFARRSADKQDPSVVARTERQIRSALDWLEALSASPWFCGSGFTRADLTAAIAITYLREKHAGLILPSEHPTLQALCDRCEAMEHFRGAAYSATEAAQSGWRASAA
ncbi:MAG: glutathione S-transferase family protein [Ideonella sp.]|nr:glutathione S-transferase family protein [Ideonella sp.]